MAEVAGNAVRMVPLTVYEPDGHESIITVTSSSGHMERVLLNLPDTMEYAALCQWVNETPDLHSFFRDYHRLQIEHWIWSQVKLETCQLNRPPDVLDVGAYDRRTWVGPRYRTFGFADTKPDVTGDLLDAGAVPAESVDLIICSEVLEHCRDPFSAVRHMRAWLRPFGLLLLSAPMLWPDHRGSDYPDYWRFTEQGWALLLGDEGWLTTKVQPLKLTRGGEAAYYLLRENEGFGFSDRTFVTTGFVVLARKGS